ncbi:MAG: HAD family hydrolase [Pseudomonadota bacterium]
MSKAEAWSTDDPTSLNERVLAELEEAAIAPGRPVIAVDADEVLVHFAEHFGEYCVARGNTFSLTEYRLDTALRGPDGAPLTREEIGPLIWGFIDEQTRWQRAVPGAAAALERLTEVAQIVVLTNAPAKMRADRMANLADLDIPYPVVMNEGGKGRALAWMASRAEAPVVFVDDSAAQHASAAKHAADVTRVHFVGSAMLKPIIGRVDVAHHHPDDWRDAEAAIRSTLR